MGNAHSTIMGSTEQDDYNDSGLAEMRNIFPEKTDNAIKNALESTNGELETACAILLAEGSIEEPVEEEKIEEPNPLNELLRMFSNIDPKKVEAVYQEYNQSMDESIAELLNFEFLSMEDNKEQKMAEKELKKRSKAPSKVHSLLETKNWKSVSDSIKVIEQYTGVCESIARQAYYRNSFHIVRAIVDLVCSYNGSEMVKSERRDVSDQDQDKRIRKIPRGGKVQAAKGLAHSAKNSYAMLQHDEDDDTDSSDDEKAPYVYSPDTEEAKEVQEILRSNLALRAVNPTFLKQALVFYKGDVPKTISLALLIIDSNCAKDTYNTDRSSQDIYAKDFLPTSNIGNKQRVNQRQYQKSIDTNELDPCAFQNEEHFTTGCHMVQNIFSISRLDFHGFVPNDAIQVLQACLEKWWKYELREREMKSQNLYISKVANVNPLEIVTGRGLHSVGGISRLKIRVKKYLNDHNYIYWEEPSYFIIEGKKSSRL